MQEGNSIWVDLLIAITALTLAFFILFCAIPSAHSEQNVTYVLSEQCSAPMQEVLKENEQLRSMIKMYNFELELYKTSINMLIKMNENKCQDHDDDFLDQLESEKGPMPKSKVNGTGSTKN